MHLKEPSSPRMAKSTSLGVLELDVDMHIVDKEDILGLTQDVKNFSDGLGRLKELFGEQFDGEEDLKVLAHERLGDVLCTLKSVLQSYPPLNTTELFTAAGALIGKIKNYNYVEHSVEAMEGAFNDAIDQLALEFSSSVSEYLMGDLQHGAVEEVKTKSYDNLLSVSRELDDKDYTEDEKEEPVVRLTVEQIDSMLMNLQAGLELAFQRAKAWSKYLKDVMAYIERRAQLEVEYSKNLSRLATSVKPALTEEGFLPLQSVYCTVLSQDVEYAKTCQATFTLLQTTKFVEPLSTRRNEHDKTRKVLKDTWNKEVKKMQESVNNLRKAQTLYITRQQDYGKAKDLSQKTESDMLSHSSSSSNLTAKIDKKKKAEDDASHKAAEAETTYKACVAEANNRQEELQRIKSQHLAAIRDQIFLSDQVIKKVTIDYFQLLQTVSAPVPVQYHTLCEASKRYEAGSQYGEFVRRLPISTSTPVHYEEFKFEPFSTREEVSNRKVSTQSNESEPSDHQSGESSPNLSSPRRQDKYRVPVRGAWTPQGMVANSDTDSQSGSSKSLDSSPSNSPYPSGHKKMVLAGSMDDLIEDDRDVPAGVKQLLAVPGTDQVDVQSIVKRHGRRRNTTFGVDFQEQVEHYHSAIPPIISKCLKEVEKRGINVKGIYRVSGVKSTVENLCQKFESDPESVSLDSDNPNVISNVLKLYLRQLPEPLLTFKLYQNFIQVAKENMSGGTDKEYTVERLHELIDKLPFSNRKTCGVLMHHLQRVASHADQNQMNSSNLGIVFGPTLLRPQGGNASLASLVDTPHQTRVVELLIVHAESLFGPREDHQLILAETPVEPLDKRNTLQVPQTATIELSQDTAMKHEPKKETSPTISLSPREQLIPPRSPGNLRDSAQTKKQGEDILLPGSANFDKKESSSSRANSDGEENGLDNGMSADSEIDSDDDDAEILLPDDSHRSKHGHDVNRPGGGAIVKRAGDHYHMTPPLSSRHSTQSLRSPASSPNLSVRSAISCPPTIKIEDSVLEFPDSASEIDMSTNESEGSNQQKLFQLPSINTWVPKGESLFTSILDSRSPQIYRRTTTPTGKTVSYPPSPQNDLQASRVSWPRISQEPLQQTTHASNTVTDTAAVDCSKNVQPSKSPKLLRKCTSFDLERSKPFPSRSSMTSPMLLRKNSSLEDSNTVPITSDQDSISLPTQSETDKQEKDCRKVVHIEEDENCIGAEAALVVPQCESKANVSHHDISIETIAGDNAVKYLVMSTSDKFDASRIHKSLEDPSIKGTDILDDNYKGRTSLDPLKAYETNLKDKLSKSKNVKRSECNIISIEKDRGAMLKTSKNSEVNGHVESKNSPKSSKEVKDLKDSPKTHNKRESPKTHVSRESPKTPNAKTNKASKTSSTEKSRSKTPASTVRSALLTSAAKLKSIGKRSPVTLLSYKSRSISIPDHSRKVPRPSSTSELGPAARPKTGRIHQTESSPTVLVASLEVAKEFYKENFNKARSVTPPLKKFELSKRQKTPEKQPEHNIVQGVRKSSVSKSTPPISLKTKTLASSPEERKLKKEKLVTAKSPSDKQVKGSQSKSVSTVKQSKEDKSGPSSSIKVPRTGKESTVLQQKGKKPSKYDSPTIKEEKSKIKQSAKRGSISSGNSDSAKTTGHLHDCCHSRKKLEKK